MRRDKHQGNATQLCYLKTLVGDGVNAVRLTSRYVAWPVDTRSAVSITPRSVTGIVATLLVWILLRGCFGGLGGCVQTRVSPGAPYLRSTCTTRHGSMQTWCDKRAISFDINKNFPNENKHGFHRDRETQVIADWLTAKGCSIGQPQGKPSHRL